MLAEIIAKIAGQEGKATQRTFRLSPSNSNRCSRSLVYQGLGFEAKDMNDRAYLVFDDGHWHEELSISWITKSGYQFSSSQLRLECGEVEGFKITGSIDGIITDLFQKDYLFEHKAINHHTFTRYKEGEIPMTYVIQCILYIKGLKKINPEIDTAILLIKNKNTAQYLEYEIFYNAGDDQTIVKSITLMNGDKLVLNEQIDGLYGGVEEKFKLVLGHIKAQTIPARGYDLTDKGFAWQCDYCNYKDLCWNGIYLEFGKQKEDVKFEQDVIELVEAYEKEKDLRKNHKKSEERIHDTLMSLMGSENTRKGFAGYHQLEIELVPTSKLDKELIPLELLVKATKKGLRKKLTIVNLRKMEASKQKKAGKKK